MSRAGWPSGMLSSSKLYSSVSSSGPSKVWKPMRPKLRSISRSTRVTGWSRPRSTGRPGRVTSTRSAAGAPGAAERVGPPPPARQRPLELALPPRLLAGGEALLELPLDLVGRSAQPSAVRGRRLAQLAHEPGQPPAPAQELAVPRLQPLPARRRGEARAGLLLQLLEICQQVFHLRSIPLSTSALRGARHLSRGGPLAPEGARGPPYGTKKGEPRRRPGFAFKLWIRTWIT